MTTVHHYRACPLCEAICGLDLRYEDGRLAAIRGDALDPFSHGHICPKGNAILDLERDPDRLRQPLRRRGHDWEEIGWDDAFAEAGERFAAVQRLHGNDALAAYLGNPNVHHFGHIAYLPSLVRLLKTRNVYSASSVDQWPHQLVAWAMYGHQFLLPIPDVDRTDWMLMLGANPVASNGSLMTAPGIEKRLAALAARGRLIVVDPRRTETAAIASEHHAIQPDGDVWLLAALLNEIRALGALRIERYAGRLEGLERALAALDGIDAAAAAAHSAVPAATIRRLARELHAAPRAIVYGRMGVSTQRHGTLCQWLIQLLNLVTGNLDREGGVLPNEPTLPLTGPGTSRGVYDRWRSRVRGLPEFAGELPVAALAEELATPGAGQVRALLTCAGNPVLSTPAGHRLDGLLAQLDFMVSIDLYVNETTRHAQLILPPASPLTQDHYDSVFNAFAIRRVARLNAAVQPVPDGARADWQIVNGLGAAFAAASSVAGSPREWRVLPEPRTLIARGLAAGGSGLELAALEAAPHGIDLGPLRPSLLARLETAHGRIECAPALLLQAVSQWRGAAASPGASVAGELRLIGRRHVRSNNSWMHNAPRLVKGPTRHQLWVHPDDLAARGFTAGDRARLRSRTGVVEVELRTEAAMLRGVVCLPHGFGHGRAGTRLQRANAVAGASYNDLTDPAWLDGPSGNAALNGLPVTLEAP